LSQNALLTFAGAVIRQIEAMSIFSTLNMNSELDARAELTAAVAPHGSAIRISVPLEPARQILGRSNNDLNL